MPRGQLGERGRTSIWARTEPAWISRGASAATRSRRVVNSSYSSSRARSSAVCELLLVFLQLRRDVALGVLDGLLADVVGRDLAAGLGLGVGDLDVIAEHLVEADLQPRDAGPATCSAWKRAIQHLPSLAIGSQLVELGMIARPDQAAFLDGQGRIVHEGGLDGRRGLPGKAPARPRAGEAL